MNKTFRRMTYDKPLPLTRVVKDQAPPQHKAERRDPDIERKLSLVLKLLERLVSEDRAVDAKRRNRSREGWENRLHYAQDSARRSRYEKLCRDSESAYAARNPHKKRG